MFAQHRTFGIKLEIDKRFLNYAYTSAETVANGSAESGASSEAEMRAAKMAAAVKEQAMAKRAAEAKAKAKAMAKAKAKAKAKALEKEERHLLAEAARAAKAAAVEAEAEAEVETSKRVQKPPRTAKEQDGAAKAAEEAAKAAEVAAKAAEVAARPLVQARLSRAGHMQPRTRHACSYYPPRSHVPNCHGRPFLSTGASGAEEGPDYHGGRRPADDRDYPARGRQQSFWNAA